MNAKGCEVIKINKNTWVLDEGSVRFFLLEGTKGALLIDSGMNTKNALDIAGELTKLPISLLNTHADPDHIGSNAQFNEFFMHPAEEENYRAHGGKGNIIPIHEGFVYDLGQRTLQVIELPGHTPGSVAVLDESSRTLISGDPIQQGTIFMFGSRRDMKGYIKSLEHLEEYRNRFDEIWPSHGVFPVGNDTIDLVKECAKKILSGEATGKPTDFYGKTIIKYDFEKTSFLCDDAE